VAAVGLPAWVEASAPWAAPACLRTSTSWTADPVDRRTRARSSPGTLVLSELTR
jgi:hypothetical protein